MPNIRGEWYAVCSGCTRAVIYTARQRHTQSLALLTINYPNCVCITILSLPVGNGTPT